MASTTETGDFLERLVVILGRITRDSEELRPLAESVLSRVEEVVSDLAAHAPDALRIGRLSEDLGRERWWTPEDIPLPPTTEPVTLGSTDFSPEDVVRVLNDLWLALSRRPGLSFQLSETRDGF